MKKISLYNDKCEPVLDSFDENSIDNVVTDPPYGLQFMGKKWDYDVPNVELWKKVYRVMKPGATLLCFAGTRTQHRMAVNIEDAGFILKDVIMWIFGTGFPKGTDISKQIDKQADEDREIIGIAGKSGSKRNCMLGDFKGGEYTLTKPKTKNAKLWNGWYSHALKPAYEPIILAVKPNEGSYTENALKWCTAGLNIDESKISLQGEKQPTGSGNLSVNLFSTFGRKEQHEHNKTSAKGRYPTNVILSHHPDCNKKCHPDCPIRILDEQTGVLKSGKMEHYHKIDKDGKKYNYDIYGQAGASRFFYCTKASKSERNLGCEDLEDKNFGFSGGANQALKEGKNEYLQHHIGLNKINKMKNHHPTVKPIKIMEYLCRLISNPKCNLYLDPFMGSGSTGIACSNLGFNFIGIEMDEEYFKIAEQRIGYSQKEEIKIEKKKKLFDNFFK